MKRKLSLFILIGALFTFFIILPLGLKDAQALVTCSPSSCSCSCGSCCTYYTCTKVVSNNFYVDHLPYVYITPSDACADSMNGRTLSKLPFTVDGTTYHKIPVTVSHNYYICEAKQNCCPPCPPSP